MKYISLFSGIGGFELGIQRAMGEQAECIGFSEIDKFALKVYTHHFPNHTNLGSVTEITEEQIRELVETNGGCDMLVGGFPCTNLTSLARSFKHCNSDGLDGPASGLFWNMRQIILWIRKYNGERKLHIVIENNASMKKSNKEIITDELQSCFDYPIYLTPLNGADFGVQTRRRLFWTTFEMDTSKIICEQVWEDVLLPIGDIQPEFVSSACITNANNCRFKSSKNIQIVARNVGNNLYKFVELNEGVTGCTRFQKGYHSDTNKIKSRTIIRGRKFDGCVADRRTNIPDTFYFRHFSVIERERLFWFPDGWVGDMCSVHRCCMLLGNTIVVKVVEFIIKNFIKVKQ